MASAPERKPCSTRAASRYDEVPLDDEIGFRQMLLDLTGGWTVPQILVDERPIGGYTELWRLDRDGQLDELADRAA